MEMYKVKIKAKNPEYKVSDEFENGMDADGVMCITFRNGKAQSVACYGVSIMQIAKAIAADDAKQLGSILRQAAVIANGILEAKRIHEEDKKRSIASDLAKAFAVTNKSQQK